MSSPSHPRPRRAREQRARPAHLPREPIPRAATLGIVTDTSTPMSVYQVTDDQFMTWARQSGHAVPIEQAPEWDAFDARVAGRAPWRRLAVSSGGDAPSAVIAFTTFTGRRFRYLWAKHGPIWLAPQTPESEPALRSRLGGYAVAKTRASLSCASTRSTRRGTCTSCCRRSPTTRR